MGDNQKGARPASTGRLSTLTGDLIVLCAQDLTSVGSRALKMGSTEPEAAELTPDPRNKLQWSTQGSVEKNLPHLLQVHTELLSQRTVRSVLEIASGFGDHIIAYAGALPDVEFWGTECNDYLVSRLNEKISGSGAGNVRKARKLDILADDDWESLRQAKNAPFDAISVTNLLNVAPWPVTEHLFEQLGKSEQPILHRENGVLAMYCCLRDSGRFLSDSDEKFDAVLRERDPEFGIRNLEDVVSLANAQGLQLVSKEFLAGGTNQFLRFAFQQ